MKKNKGTQRYMRYLEIRFNKNTNDKIGEKYEIIF